MWLDQGWGPRASEEIFRTSRGAASHSPRGHAGSARSQPLRARRPTGDLGERGAGKAARLARPRPRPHPAPLGVRRALATNFAQVSCAGAPASQCAPAGAPSRGPLFPGFTGQNPAGAEAKVPEEGIEGNRAVTSVRRSAPGLFPRPRLPRPRGPLPGAGRRSAAAPDAAGALGTRSGECRHLRVRAPGAGAGSACPAAAERVYIWGLVEEVEPRTP